MTPFEEYWRCDTIPDGPGGFPFAILSDGEVIAWVRKASDAAFITEARSQVRRLAREVRQLEARNRMAPRAA